MSHKQDKVRQSTLATQKICKRHEEDTRAIDAAGELILHLMAESAESNKPENKPEIIVAFLSLSFGILYPDRAHYGDPVFSTQRLFFYLAFKKLVKEGFLVVRDGGLNLNNPPSTWGDVYLRFEPAPILSKREYDEQYGDNLYAQQDQ